jgi:predicted nucleic acid-binding protein
MIVVVADTSPLRYLVLIGEASLLRWLYGRVLIPRSVAAELSRPQTPAAARQWIAQPPDWIEIVDVPHPTPALADLDPGERDAISLALERKAHLVLMDDREGVEEANRHGLTTTGTLGVLDRGAGKGFVNLPAALSKLRETNFRASPALMDMLLEQHHGREKP